MSLICNYGATTCFALKRTIWNVTLVPVIVVQDRYESIRKYLRMRCDSVCRSVFHCSFVHLAILTAKLAYTRNGHWLPR
jgi:hypothetical protein